jgi:hypothetical protein
MIIALGHKKQVGKDTVGRMVARHTKQPVTSFANKLKSISNQLYGWAGLRTESYYNLYPEAKERILQDLGMTPREIWIKVGNRIREVYPDTWIKCMPTDCIVTDLRFPNEFEWADIRVRVDNPRIPDTPDEADSAIDDEDRWDYILVNDGTLEALGIRVECMLQELGII